MLDKIRKEYKFNFYMSIIFLLIGYANFIVNNSMCRFFNITNIIIGFIPFIISVISLIIFYRRGVSSKKIIIINIIVIIFSILLLIVNFIIMLDRETFGKNNNINNYERTIKRYSASSETDFFPRKIPSDAKNVEFEEWPQFMQGGSVIYLSYDIDTIKMEEIDTELRNSSEYVLESLSDIKKAGDNIDMLGKMEDEIGYDGYSEKSDKFIIYILGAKKFSGEGYWNHGTEYGVIINKDKNRITYFNEYW